jgi:ketosteroid isomerase-like protein
MSGIRLNEVTPVGGNTESSAETEVTDLISKRFDGIKNKDETAVRAIVDERYNKFDDWPPFRRQEADEAVKNEFAAFKALSNYTYEFKDLKVNVYRDAAVATLHLDYQGEIDDRHFEINSRVTSVLRRQDSTWKIVHEHFSRFPEESVSAGVSQTVPSTPPPPAPPSPPRKSVTGRFAIMGFISAILSLLILPEIFGPVAIVSGAYTWRREQGNRGLFIVLLGITCMLVGIFVPF